MTVVVSLVMLLMKQMLLKQQIDQDSSIELENIYGNNDITSMHDNPLHKRNDNDNARTEIIELKEKNTELEEKVGGLKDENAGLKKQLETLKAGKDVDTVNAL